MIPTNAAEEHVRRQNNAGMDNSNHSRYDDSRCSDVVQGKSRQRSIDRMTCNKVRNLGRGWVNRSNAG